MTHIKHKFIFGSFFWSLGDEREEVEMDEYPQDPVTRAQALTNKVRRRMYKRAVREFKGIQMRSQENLQKLNFTVDLVRPLSLDALFLISIRWKNSRDIVSQLWIFLPPFQKMVNEKIFPFDYFVESSESCMGFFPDNVTPPFFFKIKKMISLYGWYAEDMISIIFFLSKWTDTVCQGKCGLC